MATTAPSGKEDGLPHNPSNTSTPTCLRPSNDENDSDPVAVASMRDLVGRPVALRFLLYVLFRLLRSLVILESDLWLLLKRLVVGQFFTQPGSKEPEVEVLTVLARRKLDPSDVARDVDFMLFHSELVDFELLEDPKWQLYTVSGCYAYLVEMPFPLSEYSFRFCDSLSEGHFKEAQRVARVPWEAFIERTNKWRHFKGKVIALTSTPHSGSEALCALIQDTVDGSADPSSMLIVSEPDAFTQLSAFAEMHDEVGAGKLRRMLLASLRFMCKDQARQQIVLLKLRPCCVRLVPHFHTVAPHVMHVFMVRDMIEPAISLFVQPKTQDELDMAKLTLLLMNTFPPLAALSTLCIGESITVNSVRPKSMIELAVALIASPIINFRRQKKFYLEPVVYYEKLISQPQQHLHIFFESCGITNFTLHAERLEEAAQNLMEKDTKRIREFTEKEQLVMTKACQLLEYFND